MERDAVGDVEAAGELQEVVAGAVLVALNPYLEKRPAFFALRLGMVSVSSLVSRPCMPRMSAAVGGDTIYMMSSPIFHKMSVVM